MSIFKKYAESLVSKEDDVVRPKVKNTFGSDYVEEEPVINPTNHPLKREDSNKIEPELKSQIDSLISKMLPNAGKIEEKVLDDYFSNTNQKPNHPETKIENQVTVEEVPNSSSVLSALRKPNNPVAQPKGLPGIEYEVYDPSKIHFMKQLPRFEMAHKEHSSIILAKECFLKYFYKSVLCLVPVEDSNIFYPWGTAYHIFRQRLSEHYGYGDNTPSKFDESKAKEAFKLSSREGIEYWVKEGKDQPAGSKFDWFTTDRLYKSFLKAYEHWSHERKLGQIKVLAVEQFFIIQLPDGRFVQGRMDEVVEYKSDLWGRDFKTTMKPENWFAQALRPNNQIKTYTYGIGKLSGRPVKGLIIQALYNAKSTKKEDKGPDVFEKLIECSTDEINSWEKEQVHWNELLQHCRDKDVWPMTEKNCQYCEYQPVCIKPTEASKIYTLQNKYKLHLRSPVHDVD